MDVLRNTQQHHHRGSTDQKVKVLHIDYEIDTMHGATWCMGCLLSKLLNLLFPPWKHYPATPKQQAILAKRGLWTPRMHWGEASKLIKQIAEQEGW